MRRPAHLVAAVASAAVGLAAIVAAPSLAGASGSGGITTVVDHLNNPRGLDVSGGNLYIAESGKAGPTCFPDGTCVGWTGSFDRIRVNSHGTATGPLQRMAHFLSIGDKSGSATGGPADVSVAWNGTVYGVIGGNSVALPPGLPGWLVRAAKGQLGKLVQVGPHGWRPVASPGNSDWYWTNQHKNLVPGQFPDSNPNGVYAKDGTLWVADAGANTLDQVKNRRVVRRWFLGTPKGSMTDSVTTCVDRGPDGAYYVGELLGGYYPPGKARVWRIKPGQKPTVWASGLTTINGCGWGPDGAFYVTEFQTAGLSEDPSGDPRGAVVRIKNGHRTTLGYGQLFWPSGFAATKDAVLVSNCSIAPAAGFGPCPRGGEVVRIPVT